MKRSDTMRTLGTPPSSAREFRDFVLMLQHAGIEKSVEEMGSDIAGRIERLERLIQRTEHSGQRQHTTPMHLADVRFVRNEEFSEPPSLFSQQLAQENERLREENAKLRQLIRGYLPHVRLFRIATIVFALCTFSFLGWLWFGIDLINPVFAVLGMFVSIGFMLMARAAGKLRKEKVNTS